MKAVTIFSPWGFHVILAMILAIRFAPAQELTWSLRYDPLTFDPAKVADPSSFMVRYLTGGVLLRLNRLTQQPEAALAGSMECL